MINYLDTSILVPLLLPEPTSESVEKALRTLPAGSLAISPWTRTELASLLARKVRMREMRQPDVQSVVRMLYAMIGDRSIVMTGIEERDFLLAAQWVLSSVVTLRGPDGLHLAVAHRLVATLWTSDEKMAEAAHAVGLTLGWTGTN